MSGDTARIFFAGNGSLLDFRTLIPFPAFSSAVVYFLTVLDLIGSNRCKMRIYKDHFTGDFLPIIYYLRPIIYLLFIKPKCLKTNCLCF